MVSAGLYSIKPWFVRSLRGVEDLLVAAGVTANAISLMAVVVSAAAGAAIAVGGITGAHALWFAVPPLCFVRIALNALDGSIARRSRSETPMGVVFNELGDRLSDVLLIGSLVFVVTPVLALASLSTTLIVSVLGLLATMVNGRRDNAGPVAKADRVGLVAAGALIASLTASTVPFDLVSWVLVGGGLVTVAARIRRMKKGASR